MRQEEGGLPPLEVVDLGSHPIGEASQGPSSVDIAEESLISDSDLLGLRALQRNGESLSLWVVCRIQGTGG